MTTATATKTYTFAQLPSDIQDELVKAHMWDEETDACIMYDLREAWEDFDDALRADGMFELTDWDSYFQTVDVKFRNGVGRSLTNAECLDSIACPTEHSWASFNLDAIYAKECAELLDRVHTQGYATLDDWIDVKNWLAGYASSVLRELCDDDARESRTRWLLEEDDWQMYTEDGTEL